MTDTAGDMSPARYTLLRTQRIKSQLDFVTITRIGPRIGRGPLIFNATKSSSEKPRLGVRISRRCGTAPVRNRIKRLLRESFRLMQHDWPVPVDLIITVKPHKPLMLAEYQKLLSGAMVKLVGELGSKET
jgi:ribonuclease P protein component